jgi:thiol-disulfide isomerase/thioredoxin
MKLLLKSAWGLLALLLSALAFAGPLQPYNQAQFDKLTAAGKPVIVVVHASWCPTCKEQAPIQSALMAKPEFKDYTMFKLDFDKDKAQLKQFKVTFQSTMIAFKGKTEVGRSVGDTQRDSLEALMKKAQG